MIYPVCSKKVLGRVYDSIFLYVLYADTIDRPLSGLCCLLRIKDAQVFMQLSGLNRM